MHEPTATFIPPAPAKQGSRGILRSIAWLSLYLVAAALLFGTISPWLADRFWICEILCHFQPQHIVGLAVVALTFLIAHRRRTAVVIFVFALIAFAVHWLPIYIPQRPRPAGPVSLRLLSANLRFDNPSPDSFFELVDREKPDVILVYELSWKWQADLQLLQREYPYSQAFPSPGHSGSGIYSRLPLEEIANEGMDGMFIIATRVVLGRTRIQLFGPHPNAPYNSADMELRNRQLAALGKRIGHVEAPTIIAGDFNTSSWAPCFDRLMAATNTLDTRRGFGLLPTFPAKYWPVQTTIDHCLASRNIGVINRRVGTDIGSDHLPILIDLRIEEASD